MLLQEENKRGENEPIKNASGNAMKVPASGSAKTTVPTSKQNDNEKNKTTMPAMNETNITTPPQELPQENVSYYDCDGSHECFLEKVKTCSPAMATINVTQKLLFGKTEIFINIEYVESVEGKMDDKCIITLVCTKNNLLKSWEGKEMECAVPLNELENFENYIEQNHEKVCSGALYEELKGNIFWTS